MRKCRDYDLRWFGRKEKQTVLDNLYLEGEGGEGSSKTTD